MTHGGQWVEGHAMFVVPPDRSVTVAVACNTDIAPWPITEALLRTWAQS